VTKHKFMVYFHPKGVRWVDSVTRAMPDHKLEDGEFRYEIRSLFEEYDRVAKERVLTRT
jgi:hypothetical protein